MDIEIDPAFFNKIQDSQKKWQDFEFMQVLGREKRAHLGRQIVYAIWPTVFDEIPYEEDEIFLHPSIFSMALSRSTASIIPKLLAEVWASGKVENITRKKLNIVNGLTLLNHEFHNFEHIIVGSNSPPPELIDEIVRAIGVLKKTSPELCELLFRSTYYLLPFCDSEQNSFADERFPGVIFINVSREVSMAALIEDIVHQSMHCVFCDVEASGALIYTVPAEGLISDYLSGPSAHRTISVLHHSALTEAASATALVNLLSDYSLDKHQQLEALARIVFLNLKNSDRPWLY